MEKMKLNFIFNFIVTFALRRSQRLKIVAQRNLISEAFSGANRLNVTLSDVEHAARIW
jgi:hypothetical protein